MTKHIVGMIGSMGGKKDFETFIKAANNILLVNEDVTFIVIGSGKLISRYKSLVDSRNINKILFTGTIDNVESIINIMDIGVLMTNTKVHGEGISNAILEFYAFRKPVIATDSGGTSEIVFNNKTGFLLKNNNFEDLSSKIESLLDDSNLCSELGSNGYKLISQKFNLDKMINSYYQLYEKLIKI